MNLLLAEDDAVSRAFLSEVLLIAGHSVDVVGDGHAALALAREKTFDLLLLDVSLPGIRGDQLLAALRRGEQAPANTSQPVPAIALTADLDSGRRGALLAAGFAAVASKPISSDELLKLVADHRSYASTAPVIVDSRPLWDDASALAVAGGNRASVAALRGLFRIELRAQKQRMLDAIAAGDVTAMAAELHRLRASCGFCGAARLGEIARVLSIRLAHDQVAVQTLPSRSCHALIETCDAVLQSLDGPDAGSALSAA